MTSLVKAQIEIKHTRERISVLFNPEEYTLNKGFIESAAPVCQWQHANPGDGAVF
jgi:hypothetical protein